MNKDLTCLTRDYAPKLKSKCFSEGGKKKTKQKTSNDKC